MGDGVFVSYRRDDSGWVAGRIYERMAAAFGEDRVFFDVLSIDVGLDFMEVIEHWIEQTEVFVLVMGPRWASIEDDRGRRRLEAEDDPHAFEVATALAAGTRIIPVLVDGAQMPDRDELPEPLQPLVRRNAYPLSQMSFHIGIQDLVARIERVLPVGAAVADEDTVSPPPSSEAEAEAASPDEGPEPGATGSPEDDPVPWLLEGPLDASLGLERYEGFRWPCWFLSPYFITNPDTGLVVLEDPLILLVSHPLGEVAPLVPVLEAMLPTGHPLLVVAPEVEGEALSTLVVNKIRGVLPNCAVGAPGPAAVDRDLLDDLAAVTGAVVVGTDTGPPLAATRLDHLGRADRAIVASDESVILGGKGDGSDLATRAGQALHAGVDLPPGSDREVLIARGVALFGEAVALGRQRGLLLGGASRAAGMHAVDLMIDVCRQMGDGARLAEALGRKALLLGDGGEEQEAAARLTEAAGLAESAADPRLAEWISSLRPGRRA